MINSVIHFDSTETNYIAQYSVEPTQKKITNTNNCMKCLFSINTWVVKLVGVLHVSAFQHVPLLPIHILAVFARRFETNLLSRCNDMIMLMTIHFRQGLNGNPSYE